METGIGKRIRARRKELGLTQEELANRMGLKSKSTICKIERGEDNLTSPIVKRYAKALETTVAYLMDWSGEKESSHPVDTFESLFIREVYKYFTPEELDDPVLVKQICEYLAFLKKLDSRGRDALLTFGQMLISRS